MSIETIQNNFYVGYRPDIAFFSLRNISQNQ